MKKILFILLVATACNVTPRFTSNYAMVTEELANPRPGQRPKVYYVPKDTLVFGSVRFFLDEVHQKEFKVKKYNSNWFDSGEEPYHLMDCIESKYDRSYSHPDDEYAEVLDKAFELCGVTSFYHRSYSEIRKDKEGKERIENGQYHAPYVFKKGDEIYVYGIAFCVYVLPKAAIEKATKLVRVERQERAKKEKEREARYNQIYNSL